MLSGMAFWLLPVFSAPFPCLGAVVQPFLLRAFRVVMYLSCIQTAVVYLVWYFVVDTLFCHIPAASLSRCVWCLLVEWGTMAWLQALPWELPTEKVPSRIGPFLIFPFTVNVLFSFDFFYFDILIYKNGYYLLADVYLHFSHFFLNVGWDFFRFLFFNREGSSVSLYVFSVCSLCLLCVCVPDEISQSFRSSLVQIHFDVFIFRCFEAENMFLLCLFFFNLCFLRLGGRFVCTEHRLIMFHIKTNSLK